MTLVEKAGELICPLNSSPNEGEDLGSPTALHTDAPCDETLNLVVSIMFQSSGRLES